MRLCGRGHGRESLSFTYFKLAEPGGLRSTVWRDGSMGVWLNKEKLGVGHVS